MQFVSARDIKEEMCVAADVRDDHGRILIARGQRLGPHHIARLRKFHIESIFIDPEHGAKVEKPSKSEIRQECERVLGKAYSNLAQEFASKRIAIDAQAINQVSQQLVEALSRCKDPLIVLSDIDAESDILLQHSVNTAVLAVALGTDLHIPPDMLNDLAVGMLFHDIGMALLPEHITRKNTVPTAQEVELIRKHSELGFEHLSRAEALSKVAANIALRHHEMMNGTGYPQGLAGDKLSTLMKIASVVEVYDTITTPRFGQPAALPDVAISYIISNAGKLFDKTVVISLCQRVALYPKGCAVQLNSGEIGVVAGTLPKAPTRPMVLVQYDNKGHALKEPLIVDLMNELSRSVVRSAHTIQQLRQPPDPNSIPRPIHPVLATLG
jgi:HD-GYP domain-containing protein (c-di-GMP phosphodiesterase class II)